MPGHYSGMSFERGRGSLGEAITRGDTIFGRVQRVADTPNTRSPRQRAAERSRTRDDGTRRANRQNDSSRAAAIKNIQDREENNPLRNFPSVLTGIGSALRQRMISLLEQGGEAVYDPSGRMVIGVYSDGPIAGSRVYTGRPMLDPDRNSDPEERAARPPAASSGDQQSSATNTAVDSASASVGAPAPPGDSPVDTSTEEAADARRARGRQTTVATSPRGLLTPARTRRRSLMAGLIR